MIVRGHCWNTLKVVCNFDLKEICLFSHSCLLDNNWQKEKQEDPRTLDRSEDCKTVTCASKACSFVSQSSPPPMQDFIMDIHSSFSQSYVTLTCGRIIPASHQSEISTFIVVVGIDPALWTEVLTKFNWKSCGIWGPQAWLFNASLLWVGKSTFYSISHNCCLGGNEV